ncbi:MAG: sigma-54 dependent transcriptional regulator [Desulfarculaceae bacterium]|nr:sigma-54 dependent transcriptional regulator [Desulfarculaceae bacterium]MCF8049233.1 sigma-54 dependent transcriptional regulator [Desulfarculaceae bacterium]MCF8066037.1 sigma-54 dependent transcriptional regulator [Desulfarculaceae bacterium]MCF8097815.1 sigma-54 dependent transcriptional regulator [Desulfarculaceae bacterium]MCF8123620.1 sigma-54 dependent transcriptional regulator [Desulfarculaceae bacterium]
MLAQVLIVDDEPSIRSSLGGILSDEGYEVSQAPDGESALALLEQEVPDIMLLDVWLPGIDGLQVLERVKKRLPELPVVMISGHGTVETAVKATRLGAYDFIEKPLDMDKILLAVRNGLAMSRLTEENLLLRAKAEAPSITGSSKAIQAVRRAIGQVAPTDSWVLITGENGTGKELVAHAIHRQSKRAAHTFVDVNCAAIPEELIESELFGHEKGAFTGATGKKRGKFDLAHQGTLFLDEIADMSLKTQAKILRILQEQRFERVGGTKTISVDVRVLAATNKDLQQEMAAGRFREDLFYRLNVIPIHVPPLRERSADVPELAADFLEHLALKHNQPVKRFAPKALDKLGSQPWPGNVRELKNLVERMWILCPDREIGLEDLPPEISGATAPAGPLPELFSGDFKNAKAAFEKAYLESKLNQNQGNVSRTAEEVGLERSHLHKKLKSLGIKTGNGD